MSYSQKIKEEAFGYFAQGFSYDALIKEMRRKRRKDFRLNRKTVEKWASDGNWEERRAAIQVQAEKAADKKRISSYAEFMEELAVIEAQIKTRLAVSYPKSFEGGVNALIKIRKYIDSLRGSRNSSLKSAGSNLDKIVAVIWRVFLEDDEIGPLLRNREEYILERIDAELEKENL